MSVADSAINYAAAPALYAALDNLTKVSSDCYGNMRDPPTEQDAMMFDAICQSIIALKLAKGETIQ